MVAQIVNFDGLDEEDTKYIEFVDSLKEGVDRAVFLVEKEDGTVLIGTNSKDRRDIVYDIYRLQELCRMLVNEAE
jgi:hypothetical protein